MAQKGGPHAPPRARRPPHSYPGQEQRQTPSSHPSRVVPNRAPLLPKATACRSPMARSGTGRRFPTGLDTGARFPLAFKRRVSTPGERPCAVVAPHAPRLAIFTRDGELLTDSARRGSQVPGTDHISLDWNIQPKCPRRSIDWPPHRIRCTGVPLRFFLSRAPPLDDITMRRGSGNPAVAFRPTNRISLT